MNLVVIPARGGSKGVPGKNIKELNGKPLISYSIEVAREIFPDNQICVTTDNEEIINMVEKNGLKVPFIRPPELATDHIGSHEVLLHAIHFYESKGESVETVILLQPTSPFRTSKQVRMALSKYTSEVDAVVSVKETSSNPYYVLFEESSLGFLEQSKKSTYTRRQDCPKVWELNGAIYIMDAVKLKDKKLSSFDRIIKFEMDELSSIDIDSKLDWEFAEFIARKL